MVAKEREFVKFKFLSEFTISVPPLGSGKRIFPPTCGAFHEKWKWKSLKWE
jgi:hypothetical protein